MIQGNIFDDRTVSIAIVTGIIGIGLISTNRKADAKNFKSQSKTAASNRKREVTA